VSGYPKASFWQHVFIPTGCRLVGCARCRASVVVPRLDLANLNGRKAICNECEKDVSVSESKRAEGGTQ
jgi:hypothetical protein